MTDRAERYRQYASNAQRRAEEAHEKAHAIVGGIPAGQPVLLGHHSQRTHERALERSNAQMERALAESERAKYWSRRATFVTRREEQLQAAISLSTEGVEVGDIVIARFTNSGWVRKFRGEVVGRTKNDWKVKAITSPYEGEEPGRIFKIAASGSRLHSANNCVRKEEGQQ